MSTATSLLAFSPLIVSACIILFLRKSAVKGALAGILVALALILGIDGFTIAPAGLKTAMTSALILTASAAIVIIPGLYLNAVLRGQGIVDGLVSWLQSLALNAERKALILLLGVLPAVESLTGFGVSLFLSVPIFFRLFAADKAYRLSLLGMNIMPWGTLALATVIGASLSGESVTALGTATAVTSAFVFPCVGLLALGVLGGGSCIKRHGLLAVLMGALLATLLITFSRIGFTETAGILAGAITGLVAMAVLRLLPGSAEDGGNKAPVYTSKAVLRLFLPYLLVLVLILVTRTIEPLHEWLKNLWILTSERVRFSVFTSPGIALALVALALVQIQPVPIDHRAVWKRAQTASLGIFCFVLLAQCMLESGMIDALATLLEQGEGEQSILLCILSPVLGMVSGFTTGSNVGGNALMMVMQHRIGETAGAGLAFSAIQNSSAGHAVFASLPIIILVMTIAREGGDSSKTAEHNLLHFTLKALAIIAIPLIGASFLVNYLDLLHMVR